MLNQKIATIVLLVAFVSTVAFAGCTSLPAITCEDKSREQLNRCNIDCGEGVGSSFCKSACTDEHQNRLELCAQTR